MPTFSMRGPRLTRDAQRQRDLAFRSDGESQRAAGANVNEEKARPVKPKNGAVLANVDKQRLGSCPLKEDSTCISQEFGAGR